MNRPVADDVESVPVVVAKCDAYGRPIPGEFVTVGSIPMTDTPLSDDVLLPCDWCGKPPSIVCPDNSYGMAYITCGDANECPVEVIVWAELPHETLEDAKRRWNTRALLSSIGASQL